MGKTYIIGTRGSDLALWQANFTKDALQKAGINSELKIIKTQGDKIQNLSFDKLEGKGFFTKEIEDALVSGDIDIAVHSHKDLPTENPQELIIAAVSDRENPSELLLIRKEAFDKKLPLSLKANAIVGTSSARRKSQLISFRNDIVTEDLRGNVPTRVNKLREGNYDAIMLASAGIERLKIGLSEFIVLKLSPKDFVPAPAQGVLAWQIRKSDTDLFKSLQVLNNKDIQKQIFVERKVLNMLDGGCQLPLGVYCEANNDNCNVWVSKADAWNELPVRLHYDNVPFENLAEQIISDLKKKSPVT